MHYDSISFQKVKPQGQAPYFFCLNTFAYLTAIFFLKTYRFKKELQWPEVMSKIPFELVISVNTSGSHHYHIIIVATSSLATELVKFPRCMSNTFEHWRQKILTNWVSRSNYPSTKLTKKIMKRH